MAKHRKADRGENGETLEANGERRHRIDDGVPPEIAPEEDFPPIRTDQGVFDLDDPVLPDWIADRALRSGGYPYSRQMPHKLYDPALEALQVELVKLQKWINRTGTRLVILFEGRDTAGKGSAIFAFRRYLNPRSARLVALAKPSDIERGQWYFQRYVAELPTAGELTMFDRSWYNRAGVETVMGFCTREELKIFLRQAPALEASLVESGIFLIKFWLDIGREMQLKRFHARRHDPLKIWKLSPIDAAAMQRWSDYSFARDQMLAATHTPRTPWTIVRANDRRRGWLAVMRHVLQQFEYAGKDEALVNQIDRKIIGPRLRLAP
jgi:polyphosphate kinase 2